MRDASVYARLWADARKSEAGRDWKEPKAENDNVLWFAGPQSRACRRGTATGAGGVHIHALLRCLELRAWAIRQRRIMLAQLTCAPSAEGRGLPPKGVERLRLPRRKPATGPLQVLHLPWCLAGFPPSPAAPPCPPQHFQMFMVRPEC